MGDMTRTLEEHLIALTLSRDALKDNEVCVAECVAQCVAECVAGCVAVCVAVCVVESLT